MSDRSFARSDAVHIKKCELHDPQWGGGRAVWYVKDTFLVTDPSSDELVTTHWLETRKATPGPGELRACCLRPAESGQECVSEPS